MARMVNDKLLPKSKYPWDEWLNGSVWALDIGSDIPSARTFQGSVYRAARERNMRVSARLEGDRLLIQARPA